MRGRECRLRVRDERDITVEVTVVEATVALGIRLARLVRLGGVALGVASRVVQRREPRERRLRRRLRDRTSRGFVERGDESARRASPRRERVRRDERRSRARRREEKSNERRRAARRRRRARFRTRARGHDGDERARDTLSVCEFVGFVGAYLVVVEEDAFGREPREGVYGRGGGAQDARDRLRSTRQGIDGGDERRDDARGGRVAVSRRGGDDGGERARMTFAQLAQDDARGDPRVEAREGGGARGVGDDLGRGGGENRVEDPEDVLEGVLHGGDDVAVARADSVEALLGGGGE